MLYALLVCVGVGVLYCCCFDHREGNKRFKAKDYPAAIQCYSEAIAINGDNHVFFGNRRSV